MALSPWLGGLQAAEGLYGLFNSGNSAANSYYQAAARDLEQRRALSMELQRMAQAYNPQADTQNAVDFAGQTAAHSLQQALGNLNAQYLGAGGNPGGDTRFNVSAQGATDRIYDPLKTFAAQQASQDYARKMAAYEAALGADNGSIASQYMQLGNTVRTDPTSSYGMIASGLRGFLPGQTSLADPATASPGGVGGFNGSVDGYDPTTGGWGSMGKNGYFGPYGYSNEMVNGGYGPFASGMGGTDQMTGTPIAGSFASPFATQVPGGQLGSGFQDMSGGVLSPAIGSHPLSSFGGSLGGNSNSAIYKNPRTQVSF
jgi:hypothetical protein